MNIMVLSPGRRVDIIDYLKKVFHQDGGRVLTLDMSPYAAALYEGDKHFVIEKDFTNLKAYMLNIIEICKYEQVNAIMTLIDPELSLLAEYSEALKKAGITPIISDNEMIQACFDKYGFYKTFNGVIKVVKTYNGYTEVREALEKNEVKFPLFAKIRCGSGSAGIGKVEDELALESYKNQENYIFQPFIKGKEYGVDMYFDMLEGKVKALFIKEKLGMRAGETDKAISVYREDISALVMKLEAFKFKGPIDVDVFESENGELFINEINPRFGGGYPHAYHAGVNFMEMLYENLKGKTVEKSTKAYKEGLIMLKHNDAKYLEKEALRDKEW